MKRSLFTGLTIGLAFIATAAAADWSSQVSTKGSQSSTQTQVGKMLLQITCNRGDAKFFVKLFGGPFPGMKNVDDSNESLMMWIQMADGRTARHPIDGYYYGPEDAFLGRLHTSSVVLDQFAAGSRLQLTTPSGATVLDTGMKGTSAARRDFATGCGF
ncbi:hypothetical protein KHP62_13440 [Rhodobacteraceae bacterium NNCM2]|nr:hypothetical protein [Coraliihabitans acroporae]